MPFSYILFAAISFIAGLLLGFFVIRQRKFSEKEMDAKAEHMLSDAKKKREELLMQARNRAIDTKQQLEIEEKEFAAQLERMEHMFNIKSASYQKREAKLNQLRHALAEEEKSAAAQQAENKELSKRINEQLLIKAGITADRVIDEIIVFYEEMWKSDAQLRHAHMMEWISESAGRDAHNILSEAIYRYAALTSVEHEDAKIIVPRDEIKGRIVGRGATNIAYFENLFGVDVIFNDEPNTIIVSAFNLVQRETARFALERLIHEKVINEEVINRVKTLAEQDVKKVLHREGEHALKILGLKNTPPDFAALVGRLYFRTSYGQNIMSHCFEVAYLARLMAYELGADAQTAWLGGFFHDLGKAIDQEVGGSHDVLSKELLEKYGFSWEITHAAWTHHNAIPQETIEARIVQAADAISASRPGARAESVARYLEKIKDLEATAISFEGVKKAYAINAGREVRVIVDAEKMNDEHTHQLATDIAARVQEKGGYPGKIKVVTIKTTKATDYAK